MPIFSRLSHPDYSSLCPRTDGFPFCSYVYVLLLLLLLLSYYYNTTTRGVARMQIRVPINASRANRKRCVATGGGACVRVSLLRKSFGKIEKRVGRGRRRSRCRPSANRNFFRNTDACVREGKKTRLSPPPPFKDAWRSE